MEQILSLAKRLIEIRSTTGLEKEALLVMEENLTSWSLERIPVSAERWNIFATPRNNPAPSVVLTTHLDVVPAPEACFQPRVEAGFLYGRGACDAKGIAATMVAAAEALRDAGEKDIGLLFVVDEEVSSQGAKCAAPFLRERGIRYLVNGEPTDCDLVTGHKGVVVAKLSFTGRAAHSGYPELGEDANARLIAICHELLETDFGESETFGRATINLGLIQGGTAVNVISPEGSVRLAIRTVTANSKVIEKLRAVVGDSATVEILSSSEPVQLKVVEGFRTKPVSYGTDIPSLLASGAQCLLYGPGTITVAHTDGERVALSELEEAFDGYQSIYHALK